MNSCHLQEMNQPGDYHVEWDKQNSKRQILPAFTHKWNLDLHDDNNDVGGDNVLEGERGTQGRKENREYWGVKGWKYVTHTHEDSILKPTGQCWRKAWRGMGLREYN
jgi:hypothetical protein